MLLERNNVHLLVNALNTATAKYITLYFAHMPLEKKIIVTQSSEIQTELSKSLRDLLNFTRATPYEESEYN